MPIAEGAVTEHTDAAGALRRALLRLWRTGWGRAAGYGAWGAWGAWGAGGSVGVLGGFGSLGRRPAGLGLVALVSLPVLLAAGLLPCTASWAQTVPRVAVSTLPVGNSQKTGTPIVYTPAVLNPATGVTSATIRQTDATNIVDWKSFDIGRAAQLDIVQPSSTAVLLNKVSGGAFQNKTVIDGVLNANGRVYLYNPNGIIFGKTGTVNTNTLIASSLKFDEARVIGGLLRQGDTPVLGADPALGRRPGAIVVEGDGLQAAKLTAAGGGLLLLAAPEVHNAGLMQAPDGQVILAAGSKVYLAAPRLSETGTSLRGLLVEVGNDYAAGVLASGATVDTSLAENAAAGRIDVGRGNATMIGYAVNQKGRVSATTSVSLNGSVYLLARDEAELRNGLPVPTRAGPLVLGPGSVTAVRTQADEAEKIAATAVFARSQVKLAGETITLQPAASIVAPGGDVSIRAQRLFAQDPGTAPPDPRSDLVRVDFGAGSVVDVSGSRDTTLAMASNIVEVDLRGTELADNLVLRESALYGSKLRIDARKGTPVAEVAGWLDQRQLGLGEVNAKGGTVNVSAGAAIIQRPGSRIDVAGGWVDYQSGHVNTSQLRLASALVDAGAAKVGVAYEAVVNLPDRNASFEAGYRQGASAGTVAFSAPIVVLQGELKGQVERGVRQRDPTAAAYPLGGQLQIGSVTDNTIDLVTGRARLGGAAGFGYEGLVRVGAGASPSAKLSAPAAGAVFDSANADQALLASQLDLDTAALVRVGFSRITALTTGNIEVSQAVTLAPGGQLWLGAATRDVLREGETQLPASGRIAIRAPISVPGGSVSANAVSVDVADGTVINLAGLWTNDLSRAGSARDAAGNPVDPLMTKGGTLNLAASVLQLGKAVQIDVSAGAAVSMQDKTSTGSAGAITLESRPQDSSPQGLALSRLAWGEGLKLAGYGFGNGASLRLLGRDVVLGAVAAADRTAGDLALAPGFFQQGGFTSYDIGANLDLSVAAGATIAPRALKWALADHALAQRSGAMASVAAPRLFALSGPAPTRNTTHLTLRAATTAAALAGRLRVLDGAKLDLDPAATLNLLAGGQLEVYGAINAPAGRVTLSLNPSPSDSQQHSIWFGPAAAIRAQGSLARLYTDGYGVSRGELLDGGSIRLGGATSLGRDGGTVLAPAAAFVVMQSGSLLNVAGVGASGLVFRSGNALSGATAVASAGGSIEVRSSLGFELLGSLDGGPGGVSASAGSLTLALEAGDGMLNVLATSTLLARINQNMALTPARYEGVAGSGYVGAEGLDAGRFARLTLRSQDAIAFGLASANLSLSASAALVLDAPTLLSDSGVRADVQQALLKVALKELKAADKAAGIKRSDDELAEAAAPVVAARLVNERLQLATPATLALSAPYVQLGNTATDQTSYPLAPLADEPLPRSALAGNAVLKVTAANIDLKGHAALQGFGRAALAASQDIRLVGMPWFDAETGVSDGSQRGSFWLKGRLELTGAQVYPTTLADFTLAVAPSADEGSGRLNIASSGAAPGAVLSAGGSITAYARHIVQEGRLMAPFGRISLGNTDAAVDTTLTSALSFGAGSLTSVAGSGPVPLGIVTNGSVPTASRWSALLADGTELKITQDPATGALTPERALPAKAIIASAGSINTDTSAVLDLSGGGSMFAYGFTPGRGGSKDVLANNTPRSVTTVFAILPGFSGKVAPVDGDYSADGGLLAGDAVWLSGLGSLPAGLYTLLPAHYALLPGAYSVSAVAASRDMSATANAVQADGSLLVAGRIAQAGSGVVGGRTQGFEVAPAAVVRRRSEFALYDAGSYFTAKADAAGVAAPPLPADGGHVVLAASDASAQALRLDGTIKLGAVPGGLAGLADIAADRIEIASNAGISAAGVVRLSVAQLTGLGARSLSLGAVRDEGADSTALRVRAREIALVNDAAQPLLAPELLLAAKTLISLAPGASVRAEGTPGTRHAAADLELSGPGVLLRASSGGAVTVTRRDDADSAGALEVGRGATVAAAGALQIDASGRVVNAGKLLVDAGGAFSASVPAISLGSAISKAAAATTLAFDTAALERLSALASVSLNSRDDAIGLYGDLQLGGSATRQLTLAGAGLVAMAAASGAEPASAAVQQAQRMTMTADRIRLEGSLAPNVLNVPNASATASQLGLAAQTIALGSGSFALLGFEQAGLTASADLRAAGRGGLLWADGALRLDAGRITTDHGADALFRSSGTLALSSSSTLPALAVAAGFGGQLAFEADRISSTARIVAPSGRVTMQAAQQLDLNAGLLSVAGAALHAGSTSANVAGATSAYGPGGTITLSAAQIHLASGAALDLSAVGADAGLLTISAVAADGQGQIKLQGSLRGSATAVAGLGGVAQGRFKLDADNAGASGAFGALNTVLNDAGFTQARDFRFRQGDVQLTGNDTVIARELVIAADAGSITLGGNSLIDASGPKGGSIELAARQAPDRADSGRVTLTGSARLVARGTAEADSAAGSLGQGGRVVIATTTADGGAVTAVAGGASIHLASAQALAAADGVAAVAGGYIDVAGSSTQRNGTVTLRAPRLADGSDLAVASLTTEIRNSAETVVEGFKVYQASTISERADSASNLDASQGGRMYQDAAGFSQQQPAILDRLNAAPARLRAGIEVRSLAAEAGTSLSVSVNEFAANAADRGWDLQAWRFAGQPINLSLRAAGNLNVIGSISDGFVKPADAKLALPVWALAGDSSGDLRLVAGADLGAAHAMAVVAGQGDLRIDFAARTPEPAAGSTMKEAGSQQITSANPNAPVTLTDAPVALVRSGSGRIDVGAGRDVTLGMAKFYVSADRDETLERPLVFDSRNPNDDSYNVTLFGASLYTAGQSVALNAPAFGAPRNAANLHYGASATALAVANFASGGGAVTVAAGRDINGAQNRSADWTYRKADGIAAYVADPDDPTDISTPAQPGKLAALPRVVPQLVNNWLFRQGRSTTDADGNTQFETLADGKTTLNTAWWVRPDYFGQGIATLGGGDVTVSAGRHVSNLSVSAASNAYVALVGTAVVEHGGGDLSVRAGGDIAGGVFYAQKGLAALRADGSLVSGLVGSGNAQDNGRALAPVIALGDAQVSVVAARSLLLETVFNPTMTEQSVHNQKISGADFSPLYQPNRAWDPTFELGSAYRSKYAQFSNFVSYTADSTVRLTALGGDLALSANAAALATAGQWEIPNRLQAAAPTAGLQNLYTLLPPTLLAASLGGDISTANGVALSPAATGQLALIAAGSIRLNNGVTGSLRMLDNDPLAMSHTGAPRVLARADTAILAGSSTALESHARAGLHAHDTQPARLLAVAGDIVGDASAVSSLSLPKAVTVTAGRDIVDLGLRLQHSGVADVSLLQAGRDIVDTTQAIGAGGAPSEVAHGVGGAGRIDLLAGRNVDLGNGSGVVTRGNLDNPYLAEGSAAIRVVAGVKAPDYASFVVLASRYGSAYDVTSPLDAAALAAYVRGQATGDVLKNWAYFRALPATAQARLLAKSAALAALAADPAGPADIAATISLADAKALAKFVGEADHVLSAEQTWAFYRALPANEQAEFIKPDQKTFVLKRTPTLKVDATKEQVETAFLALSPAAQKVYWDSFHPELAIKLAASSAALSQALASGDTALLDQRFFASLVETGKLGLKTPDNQVIGSSLKNFDALIASLFPDAAAAAGGDISNFGSQFKTEQGGAITLYAPAGSTYAGLTLGYSLKLASAQGIFTVRGGAVSALVENDFLVNKGRVFTLGGGDITLVSQKADIDAGKGAKTAASAPPPLITVDPNGNVKVDVANSITGSGIATLKTRADIAPGNVYAIAPRGVFDAGDAGVRSSGSVLVVAPTVLNAGNISAGGAIVGAQVVVAAPSLGGVAAPSNTATKTDDVAKAAANSTANSDRLPLTVDALGYGSDTAAGEEGDDGEDSDDPKKKKKKKK